VNWSLFGFVRSWRCENPHGVTDDVVEW
jgi:hypothetical protein